MRPEDSDSAAILIVQNLPQVLTIFRPSDARQQVDTYNSNQEPSLSHFESEVEATEI